MQPYSVYLSSNSNPPPLVYLKEGETPPPLYDTERKVHNLSFTIPEASYLAFIEDNIKNAKAQKASIFFLGTSVKMRSDFLHWVEEALPCVLEEYSADQLNLEDIVPKIANKLKEGVKVQINMSSQGQDRIGKEEDDLQKTADDVQQSMHCKGHTGRAITLNQALLLLKMCDIFKQSMNSNHPKSTEDQILSKKSENLENGCPPPGVYYYEKDAPLPPAYDIEKKICSFPFTYSEILYLKFLDNTKSKSYLKKEFVLLKTSANAQVEFFDWLIKYFSNSSRSIDQTKLDLSLKSIVPALVDKAQQYVKELTLNKQIMTEDEILEAATELTKDVFPANYEIDLEKDLPILMEKATELNNIMSDKKQAFIAEERALQSEIDQLEDKYVGSGTDGRLMTRTQMQHVYRMFKIAEKNLRWPQS